MGFWIFFHDVMIFDFKFGSNRTAGSEDTIVFVAVHGPHRTIPLLVVSDFRVSYVTPLLRTVRDICESYSPSFSRGFMSFDILIRVSGVRHPK